MHGPNKHNDLRDNVQVVKKKKKNEKEDHSLLEKQFLTKNIIVVDMINI